MMEHFTDPDLEHALVDSTTVRAHACASGYELDSQKDQALGRGGFTTKIHALVDALGNPLNFILTPGQRNDITQAKNLTQSLDHSTVIADKGYDSDSFVEYLENKGNSIVIPPRKNCCLQINLFQLG